MARRPVDTEARHASPSAKQQAKRLRAATTPPEVLLWSRLRRKQLGHKFRRQHALGPYIIDFYCVAAALAIEVDGAMHRGERRDRDAERDQWLADRGVRVLRISTIELGRNMDGVLRTIKYIADERSPLGPDTAEPEP